MSKRVVSKNNLIEAILAFGENVSL